MTVWVGEAALATIGSFRRSPLIGAIIHLPYQCAFPLCDDAGDDCRRYIHGPAMKVQVRAWRIHCRGVR